MKKIKMNKIALLTLVSSTLLIAPTVLADENIINPVEPTNPNIEGEISSEEPVTPIEPTTPGTSESGTEETTEPTTPGTSEPGTEETTEPTTPGTSEPGTEETTEPTTPGTSEPGTEETTESTTPRTSESVVETPAESVNPTDETPVETEYGNIVGTNNGNVTLKTNDGSTKIVPANVVGGTIQNDGTIKIKSTDGKMKVLPKAGMKENPALLSLIGILMVGMGIVLKKRI